MGITALLELVEGGREGGGRRRQRERARETTITTIQANALAMEEGYRRANWYKRYKHTNFHKRSMSL